MIGGLISTISALNATIYSSSRVAFAMGRDRNFPTFFSRVHPQKFTPHWAILVSLIIVVLMAISLPIEDVASVADIMFLLLFLQVNLAVIRLRKKRPDLDRGFIAPLFPWLSIVGIVLLLAIAVYMFNYSPVAWIVTIIWIVAGLLVYYAYASRREVAHIQKVKALERIERKDYRIMVCLANPRSLEDLTNIALAIDEKNKAKIIFLTIVEIDEGHQLQEGYQATTIAQSLLDQAVALASDAGVASRTLIKVARRISQGIIETAVEEECNFIILGRQQHSTFLAKVFSSLIDTVIQKSPSEVAILHGKFNSQQIRTILIPCANDIHAQLAAEIVPGLCEFFKAELKIGYVMDPALPEAEKKAKIDLLQKFITENSLPAAIVIINEDDTLKGVLKMTREVDLMIMGGRSGEFLELLAGKSLAQEITEQSKCPVLWIKEYEERPSFWALLFKSANQNKNQKAGDQ